MSATKPALPEPVAETVMDLFQDHEGPVAALDYLPIGTKLYTADQMREYVRAAMAAAKPKPLTDEQIWALHEMRGWFPQYHYRLVRLIRAIEAATLENTK